MNTLYSSDIDSDNPPSFQTQTVKRPSAFAIKPTQVYRSTMYFINVKSFIRTKVWLPPRPNQRGQQYSKMEITIFRPREDPC